MTTKNASAAVSSALRTDEARAAAVRRGQTLSRVTLIYNSLEGIAAVTVGAMAGSVSLVGFGIDSVIEVLSSVAALWRLRADADLTRRAHAERQTLKLIGLSFLALSAYILIDAGRARASCSEIQ